MAAITQSLRQDHVFGNLRVVTARATSASDGDTWVPGLAAIVWVGVTDRAAAATEDIGLTWSGGTVTFAIEGGTPSFDLIALGY